MLIEAQYFGVPVISSDCSSGPKEIFLNEKAGTTFKTGNYFDLKDKIKLFLGNKNSLINVGSGNEYSIKKFATKIAKVVNCKSRLKFNKSFPDGT